MLDKQDGIPTTPQLRYEVPMGGGPAWIGYALLQDLAMSAAAFLVQCGIATREEMQIDTLAARLRAEVVRTKGVLYTLPALGLWAGV
jgi:hypothetical protein